MELKLSEVVQAVVDEAMRRAEAEAKLEEAMKQLSTLKANEEKFRELLEPRPVLHAVDGGEMHTEPTPSAERDRRRRK